jgi:hypothetical protein
MVFRLEAFLEHFQEVNFYQSTSYYENVRQLYILQLWALMHQYVILIHLLFQDQFFSIDSITQQYRHLLIFSLFTPTRRTG